MFNIMSAFPLVAIFLVRAHMDVVRAHEYVMTTEQLTHEVEKLTETGTKLSAKVDQLTYQNNRLATEEQKLAVRVSKLEKEKGELAVQVQKLTQKTTGMTGSAYVRWGRKQCPYTAATIYSGYAGGSYERSTGSGANRLCLSADPVFGYVSHLADTGKLYGAQYWISGRQSTDVVCALCYTSYSATFMVPGTNRCPAGSVLQYRGYLSSGEHNDLAQSEYVCLDAQPEDRVGSATRHDSGWFEHVLAVCGSLPCPPYRANKVVTCAVCSK